MPTYDYKCKACGHRWELFQSMSSAPVKVCPSCGKKQADRLIGIGAAVLFKGSGFYQTDYRSDSYKKSADAETKSNAPADTSKPAETKAGDAKPAETKVEAKPEAKPAAQTAAKVGERARTSASRGTRTPVTAKPRKKRG